MDTIKNGYIADLLARRILDRQDHFRPVARVILRGDEQADHLIALRGRTLFYVVRSPDETRAEIEEGDHRDLATKLDHLGAVVVSSRDDRVELDLSEFLLEVCEEHRHVEEKVDFLRELSNTVTTGDLVA
jgi:hypothetical protein